MGSTRSQIRQDLLTSFHGDPWERNVPKDKAMALMAKEYMASPHDLGRVIAAFQSAYQDGYNQESPNFGYHAYADNMLPHNPDGDVDWGARGFMAPDSPNYHAAKPSPEDALDYWRRQGNSDYFSEHPDVARKRDRAYLATHTDNPERMPADIARLKQKMQDPSYDIYKDPDE